MNTSHFDEALERKNRFSAEDFRSLGDSLLNRARSLARDVLERAHHLMRAGYLEADPMADAHRAAERGETPS